MNKINAIFVLALFFSFSVEGSGTASSFDKQTPAQLESLESLAAAGNEKAQMKLANMYLEGKIVTTDTNKALYYYRLAADRDIAFAQYKLAKLYLDGKYLEPDPEQALTWLLRASKLGLIQAQLSLGLEYEKGVNTPQDFIQAHKWLEIASSLTDKDLKSTMEELETKMTFIELAHAKLLSNICIITGYQVC
ncbi:MAG: tetratricopeptide repeat protein [bacterium]